MQEVRWRTEAYRNRRRCWESGQSKTKFKNQDGFLSKSMLSLKTTSKAEELNVLKSVMPFQAKLHTWQILKVISYFLLKAGRTIQAFSQWAALRHCPAPWEQIIPGRED